MLNNVTNLDNYKYACLMERAVIYEDNIMQIGIISKFYSKSEELENPLELLFHYCNKTLAPI